MEINRSDYHTLLRVPGIGVRSARRIIRARRYGELRFEDLKKMGVVLKRAQYFITCKGRMLYPVKLEEEEVTRNLLNVREKLPFEAQTCRQMNLFTDFGLKREEPYADFSL